jgi:hypothetical protein
MICPGPHWLGRRGWAKVRQREQQEVLKLGQRVRPPRAARLQLEPRLRLRLRFDPRQPVPPRRAARPAMPGSDQRIGPEQP